MELVTTCPLGSVCEEIKDNKIHRCLWYQELRGKDANGEDSSESRCAMAWMPELIVEANHASRNVQKSTESFRNEMMNINTNNLKLISK